MMPDPLGLDFRDGRGYNMPVRRSAGDVHILNACTLCDPKETLLRSKRLCPSARDAQI